MTRLFHSAVVVALLLCVSATALAQAQSSEVNLVTANLVRGPINELIKSFEAKTGYKVKAAYSPGGAARQNRAYAIIVLLFILSMELPSASNMPVHYNRFCEVVMPCPVVSIK